MTINRRMLLRSSLAMPLIGLDPPLAFAQGGRLASTPECVGGARRTVESIEGPFFKPRSPMRNSLIDGDARGERILLGGFVTDERCRPIPGALVELWHADSSGRYDNAGFRLRGHQLTDERGLWRFSTIMPGAYPGRTRHYHLKVQRPNDRVLTTQLYFPDEAQNRRDSEFDPRLLMRMGRDGDRPFGRFDFVL